MLHRVITVRGTGARSDGGWHRFAAIITTASIIAASGGDDPSAQEQYCDAGASLRSSVAALSELDLIAQGASGLEAVVDDIGTSTDELRDAAAESTGDEVEALQESVDELDSALSDLGGSISADNVAGVRTAIGNVATAAQDVYETLTDC